MLGHPPTAESYCAYTVHYLNMDMGEITSKVLECSKFEDSHHSIHLTNDIKRVECKFRLEQKIINITADNASISKKVSEMLELIQMAVWHMARRRHLAEKV